MPTDRRESLFGTLLDRSGVDPPASVSLHRLLRYLARRTLPGWILLAPVVAWALYVGGLDAAVLLGLAGLGWSFAYLGGFVARRGRTVQAAGFAGASLLAVVVAARAASLADGTGGVAGVVLVLFGTIGAIAALFGAGAARGGTAGARPGEGSDAGD